MDEGDTDAAGRASRIPLPRDQGQGNEVKLGEGGKDSGTD